MSSDIISDVKDYYGKTLQTSADLKTEACCTPDAMPGYVKAVLSISMTRFWRSITAAASSRRLALEGRRILDLGLGLGP